MQAAKFCSLNPSHLSRGYTSFAEQAQLLQFHDKEHERVKKVKGRKERTLDETAMEMDAWDKDITVCCVLDS